MDFAAFLKRVGANIRRARWLAGLTQEQVAALGVTYRYYQEIERGQRNPTARTLFTLARVLKTTVGALTDVEPAATARARERLAKADLRPPALGRKPRRAAPRR